MGVLLDDTAGWARFGLGVEEVDRLRRYVRRVATRLARRHPDPATVRGDIEQAMWLKGLTLLGENHDIGRGVLRTAMYRAGCDFMSRQVDDAPYEGRRKNWSRMVSYEEVLG